MNLEDKPSATVNASITMPFPIGTVIPYVGKKESLAGLAPLGWLLCDGTTVQISKYRALFDVIGATFGGDATTTFTLPDLRGIFLRGVDATGVLDPDHASRLSPIAGNSNVAGAVVGSRQLQSLQNHTHYWDRNFGQISPSGDALNVQLAQGGKDPDQGRQPTTNNDGGGNETRPVNVYVYYLIFAGLVST